MAHLHRAPLVRLCMWQVLTLLMTCPREAGQNHLIILRDFYITVLFHLTLQIFLLHHILIMFIIMSHDLISFHFCKYF